MTDQAPELLEKWRKSAQQHADAAAECYDRSDDNEGDMNAVEVDSLRRCARELEEALTRPPSERPVGQNPCSVCSYNGSGWCQSWACPRRPVAQVREALELLSLEWRGWAQAIRLMDGKRETSDPASLRQAAAYDECGEKLRAALTAERPEAGRETMTSVRAKGDK